MLTMDQIHRIRELYYQQGMSMAEIAKQMHCDWRTVRKYLDQEDFSPKQPKPASEEVHTSKLDPYKPKIDEWLRNDKKAPRKQRHTAKRIYDRLKNETEGFSVSYRLVATYVKAKKKELNLNRCDGFIPLVHPPGPAQADFGEADFYEHGQLHHKGKYLVLSFPYSNGGFLQLNYGENLECLLEGLKAMFEYIGGVPPEIWFDNTKTIVTKVIKGGERKLNSRFIQFAEHYRFKAVFMNPASGNEKGNVESKVGYLRNNLLVPVPEFEKLPDFNRELLKKCDHDMEREHYEENGTLISELFKQDKEQLLPLPAASFETSFYTDARTDKYGWFTLDNGKHAYSASPACYSSIVRLKLTSSTVTVMNENNETIIEHRRLYGDEKQVSMNWMPYLKYIARKPRSLHNSGIYDMMPENMQKYLDQCANTDRGRILKVLSELTDRTGFDSALATVNEAIKYQATDPDSLKSLYHKLYTDVPQLPPLNNTSTVAGNKFIGQNTDLAALDKVLEQRGVMHG